MPRRKKAIGADGGVAVSKRAAAYVRMSTEHQQYSTENQLDTLKLYAATHGLEISKVYVDSGKSGLRLEGREGLQQLFSDVESGQRDYGIILVYDVSRWGRFQDPDESASYEVRCRHHGVRVEYCAEQFTNDGSPISSIIKSIKRMMAGEYSRELSVKVFKGQSKLVELGFRVSGTAGYGLRRQLIDIRGIPKAILEAGEHKSIQTDRVVLVPGPESEQRVVRAIYTHLVCDHLSPLEISKKLNASQDTGRIWNTTRVLAVLTNEKYIGNNVWNHKSYKLKSPGKDNPQELWVRANRAFLPIVDQKTFDAAQVILNREKVRIADVELLKGLKRVFQKEGKLNMDIIDAAKSIPSASFYARRFGGILKAYELVGYEPYADFRWVDVRKKIKEAIPGIRSDVLKAVQSSNSSATVDPVTKLVVLNNEITISVVVAWYISAGRYPSGWRFNLEYSLHPDITVIARFDFVEMFVRDYLVIPMNEMLPSTKYLSKKKLRKYEEYRFDTLDALGTLSKRTSIV